MAKKRVMKIQKHPVSAMRFTIGFIIANTIAVWAGLKLISPYIMESGVSKSFFNWSFWRTFVGFGILFIASMNISHFMKAFVRTFFVKKESEIAKMRKELNLPGGER